MSVLATFATLGRGERPAGDGFLGTARVEYGGGEAFGEEAALELFRAAPIDVVGGILIETNIGAAWFGENIVLIADLYSGRVGRLWLLGSGIDAALEPFVAVAFDPDLHQTRGDVHFRLEDHPALGPAAVDPVIAAGKALIARADHGPWYRSRAFIIRAFGDGTRSVALFAMHRLSSGPVRSAGFAYAAALIDAGDTRLLIDRQLAQEWTPRL